MTVKELLSILESIPYGILTYDNSDYEFLEVKSSSKCILPKIDIHFKYDKLLYCYLDVAPDYTIYEGYAVFCDFDYDRVKKSVPYKNCVQAMHNTKTYLEILGFKTIWALKNYLDILGFRDITQDE